MRPTYQAIFLFPPNWSACVTGPHLALPLIAGTVHTGGVGIETWDLSERFYRLYSSRPSTEAIVTASSARRIDILDKLYFDWEDSLATMASKFSHRFGLLSGFTGGSLEQRNVSGLIREASTGSVFTEYFETVVRPTLQERNPCLVGITVSSHHQLPSAVELILRIRKWMPATKIVLGGNVVTRLRTSPSFGAINTLVDQIVLYQGELAIKRYLAKLFGASYTKRSLQTGDQSIPYNEWPVPCFNGLDLEQYPGLNAIPYVSTRGCYWGQCPFCAIPAGWSKRGYAGSAPAHFIVDQLARMIESTGIRRIKFVDEAFPPAKVLSLFNEVTKKQVHFLWEAYVRAEQAWEDEERLLTAFASGCRRLYFGLEVSPDANRSPLGKNDKGDIIKILETCGRVGIQVHLFCMVGHPRTSRKDAERTTQFLIDHQDSIETADLVGFRLDRGTTVPGVRPKLGYDRTYELATSYPFEETESNILSFEEVHDLEYECQERIWEEVPRLLHPLYRIGNPWGEDDWGNIPKSNKSELLEISTKVD